MKYFWDDEEAIKDTCNNEYEIVTKRVFDNFNLFITKNEEKASIEEEKDLDGRW